MYYGRNHRWQEVHQKYDTQEWSRSKSSQRTERRKFAEVIIGKLDNITNAQSKLLQRIEELEHKSWQQKDMSAKKKELEGN